MDWKIDWGIQCDSACQDKKKKRGGGLIRVHEMSVIRTNMSCSIVYIGSSPMHCASFTVFFSISSIKKKMKGEDLFSILYRSLQGQMIKSWSQMKWSNFLLTRNDMIDSVVLRIITDKNGPIYWTVGEYSQCV